MFHFLLISFVSPSYMKLQYNYNPKKTEKFIENGLFENAIRKSTMIIHKNSWTF